MEAKKIQENLYKTMHNCHTGYRFNNQGLFVMCDWLHLLKDGDGKIHDPWADKPISIIEVGCGNGRLCDVLSLMKFDVTGSDLVTADVVYDRSSYKFIQQDMTEPFPCLDNEFDYCINFDVMEHIPEDRVSDTLKEMGRISRNIIIKIASSGQPPLHITVHNWEWWMLKLKESCPEFSWQLIRNHRQTNRNGDDVFAPLFYGWKGGL